MSKDEALDKWLKTRPQGTAGEDYFVSAKLARSAWHAAVKHTLEHVAENFRRSFSLGHKGDRKFADELAGLILKMKP